MDIASVTTSHELLSLPTVAIETHGCKLNQADSMVLAEAFAQAGFQPVTADRPADVYVINSCTVTHIADRKARRALRAARRRNPEATVVATGCYAQRAPGVLNEIDEIDLVIGNVDKPTLVQRVIEFSGRAHEDAPATVDLIGPGYSRTRAMVKIQEGCNQVCAYCIVPTVRGRERSIPAEEIVSTINQHISHGYKEVVLTGTQLGSYGFDLQDIDLTGLIGRILGETSVSRLRVSSLQPQEIDERILSLWTDVRLCPHFHLPLQSGSDAVLKKMRRRYTASQYLDAVELIRSTVPGSSITADVIVGFPGESDEDFQETYSVVEKVGFADIHVFPYSIRPGTSAAHYGSQIDAVTKSRRGRELVCMAERHARTFRMSQLGQVRPVLWEKRRADGKWIGLTDSYVRVQAESDRPLENEVTLARLTAQKENLVQVQVLDNFGAPAGATA